MIHAALGNDFESWRAAARRFVSGGFPPDQIVWTKEDQGGLFSENAVPADWELKVPGEFIRLAEVVACADDNSKWPLLYRILFRLKHENGNLLSIESDADVRAARVLEKAVRRDVHKFHAF